MRLVCADCGSRMEMDITETPFCQRCDDALSTQSEQKETPDGPASGGRSEGMADVICKNCGNTGIGIFGEPCPCKGQVVTVSIYLEPAAHEALKRLQALNGDKTLGETIRKALQLYTTKGT